jgi:hypothetical protein
LVGPKKVRQDPQELATAIKNLLDGVGLMIGTDEDKAAARKAGLHPADYLNQPKWANPVYVLYLIDHAIRELEFAARHDTFAEAAAAYVRGCSWRDYDKGKWTK